MHNTGLKLAEINKDLALLPVVPTKQCRLGNITLYCFAST